MGDEKYHQARIEMLSKEYATFNGKLTIPNYNREERRKYVKEHKHNKNANVCPHCNKKTMKITDDYGKLFCELCGKIVEYKELGTGSQKDR